MRETVITNISNREGGFGLIEVMTALGLSSIVFLVIVHMTSASFRDAYNTQRTVEINETVQEIKMTFLSPKQCTFNLKGKALSMANKAGVTIEQLSYYDDSGNPGQQLFSIHPTSPDQPQHDLRLVPVAQVDTSLLVADLNFTFQKVGPDGPTPVQRVIPVFARVQSGQVTECWIKQNHARLIYNRVCYGTSNGANDTYDPATGTCTLANSKWISGTKHKARCPAGSAPRPDADGWADCSVELPPGFEDIAPKSKHQLRGGGEVELSRSPVHWGMNSRKECECNYGKEIDGSAAAGAKCQIRCIIP